MSALPELPRAAPPLALSGVYKVHPEDFQVRECLPFVPGAGPGGASGEGGEHVYLLVRKRGLNTLAVREALATYAGVPPQRVGYAGLKDRQALTWQWFSVHLPGAAEPDWTPLQSESLVIEAACRHPRKLQVGAHRGNAFRVVLRRLQGDLEALPGRMQWLAQRGFPNYFGEQRFGRDASNLARPEAFGPLRRGRLSNRQKLQLSAFRSCLFNAVLARRVEQGSWDRALPGDLMNLDGSQSVFGPVSGAEDLAPRLVALDIHPTGPLPGADPSRCAAAARELEAQVLADYPELLAAIARSGASPARRALRARAENLQWKFLDSETLQLEFTLARGSYATALLRELGSVSAAAASESRDQGE